MVITRFPLTPAIRPYCPSLLAGPLDGIQCSHRVYVWIFTDLLALVCRSPYANIPYEFAFTSAACLVLLWMVFEMWVKWPYRCCFVGCYCQDLFQTTHSVLVLFPSSFFSMRFVVSRCCIQTVILTRSQFGRNPILFHRRDIVSIWSTIYQ